MNSSQWQRSHRQRVSWSRMRHVVDPTASNASAVSATQLSHVCPRPGRARHDPLGGKLQEELHIVRCDEFGETWEWERLGLVPEHLHHDWDSCPVISHHHLISQLCTVQGEEKLCKNTYENMEYNLHSKCTQVQMNLWKNPVDPEVIERCTGKSTTKMGMVKSSTKNVDFPANFAWLRAYQLPTTTSECLLTIYSWMITFHYPNDYICLVVYLPLRKIFVSWEYDFQYMESHKIPWFQTTNQRLLTIINHHYPILKQCSKPPTSHYIHLTLIKRTSSPSTKQLDIQGLPVTWYLHRLRHAMIIVLFSFTLWLWLT